MVDLAFLVPGDLSLPTGGYTYDRRVMALLGAHGVPTRHVALPGSFPSPTAGDLAETARIVAALPRDAVLLVDGLALGAMPEGLMRGFDRPLVALCHHPLCLEAGLTAERRATLKDSETTALALARSVVVTSPTTKSLLTREFGIASQKIVVAVPGTDPAPRAEGTGSPLSLLAVGSVVPRKAYDILVKALVPLGDRDWHLTVAGATDRSPEAAAQLAQLIASSGLSSRVSVLGAVGDGDLSRLYTSADLFVLASLYEGYGMVLAEAMARGLPIVCTTGGAAAETAPAEAAIKVAPGDASALSGALARVMDDAALRRDMAKASWIAGLNLPRWEDTARILAGVVKKVQA